MSKYASFDNTEPTLQAGVKPTYKDVVTMVANYFKTNRVDTDPAWFIGHLLEPESPFEKPALKNVSGSKDASARWEYPYQNRVRSCAISWIQKTSQDRDLITAGREDDVYWRGEDVDVFMHVYRETNEMRKDKQAYRENMRQKISRLSFKV